MPATAEERKEMERLLHEGMDAGLTGFSVQRLGPNSVQADFDGTPMVTDTMVDDDIFALAEVLAERDEGSIQFTQGTGDVKGDQAFLEMLAERGPAARPAQRGGAVAEQPRGASQAPPLDRGGAGQGPADLRPVRHGARRVRLHPRALEPLRRLPGVAGGDHRDQGREDREDAGPGAPPGAGGRGRRRPIAGCASSRPASVATPPGSSSRASTASRTCRSTWVAASARSPRKRASTRSTR